MSTSSVDRAPAAGRSAPDPEIWPDLGTPRRAPLRARVAEALFRRAVGQMDIRVSLPDGSRLGAGGPEAPRMWLHRPVTFFNRLGVDAKIGFGESYLAGDWSADALAEVLTPFAERVTTLVPPFLQRLRRFVDRAHPPGEDSSVTGARSNIRRHYDLSNEMFATFLDETMTYSSALFGAGDDLADAQRRKIDGVLDHAGVRSGTELLEIGTGWGELAIRAARRGARVTTVTLSEQQRDLALRRIGAAGVADRVDIRLSDYREVRGSYDAVVSVEMIEAVGGQYWPDFFGAVGRRLRPGGRVGLQAITMPHERMLATASSYTWMHKYIFPGGLLPSVEAIERGLAEHAALRLRAVREFGQDYARTLREWRERFTRRWQDVAGLGFDEVFRRMWEFYLAYSEAGFRARYLKVHQLSFA
ncbi:SAM-dependent methyltransferase [Amycolatopsis cihanbeyliensis]|uniref:Cyclopropane-fatty-acyl-phospholipid synthase n=1 Tax=Amycolatopsis cihanbeyliensis TaxID=1128664 RepID=A0A542CSP0_AMYCI|nr:cyclopropane-fatty-acyl-phospholipid synthase family protein [Amycolatopsis cihanbeyliensis]TQI93837.1 cyclopropane-fatty-acyl-phospholipid synthase [Amycolatopsis cihanbeyliensis]